MYKSAAVAIALASCLLAPTGTSAQHAQPVGSSGLWNAPKFADEFDTSSVGTTWSTSLGEWTGTAPGAFDPSNVLVQSGNLKLKTTYPGASFSPFAGNGQEAADDCKCGFENIATSMVVSNERFQYGFFEVRARAQSSTLMNSFWLQGEHSEINVMEYVSDATTGFERSNHHCWSEGSDQVDEQEVAYDTLASRTGWHTYGVEWSNHSITFYVDGAVQRTLFKSAVSATRPECMAEPMNIILSVETSQEAGIPAEFSGAKNFVVDYVRHWDTLAPPTTTAPHERKSCADLAATDAKFKFSKKAKAGFEGVCVGQFGLFSKCSHLKKDENMRTFAEAEDQCSALGARLCTALELSKNVGKAVGCNFAQRRYMFTSDGGCPAGQASTAFGMFKNNKPAECVPTGSKLHVRCCSDADLSSVITGEQASQGNEAGVAGALPMTGGASAGSSGTGDAENAQTTTAAAGGSAILAAGIAIVAVAAVIAAAVGLRGRAMAAEANALEAGQHRRSFDDCIDAVSAAGSIDSVESTDVPSYAHDSSTADGPTFEENGFVLDCHSAVRVKSVRRGNPAFRASVHSTTDVAEMQDTAESNSSM